MHINLLVGLAVVLAVVWLMRNWRQRREGPGDMLKDELEKRRFRQEAAARAEQRLRSLQDGQLQSMAEGLEDMRRALPDADRERGAMSWEKSDGKIMLRLKGRDGEEAGELTLSWNVPDFEMELFSSSSPLHAIKGEYVIQWPGGRRVREADSLNFMRLVSEIVADSLH